MEDHATRVWNRACEYMAGGVPESAREGDRRLVDAISLDGAVQGNGVVQALGNEHATTGIQALRWFGLHDAADVLDGTRAMLDGLSEEEQEQVELQADSAYYGLNVEQRLDTGLRERLRTTPEAFLS